jgi:glycosyltransferase involved in cell wall biosynthesis
MPTCGVKVAICVATYRRPQGLTRLLEAIGRLVLGDPEPEVCVVLIDNDPDGTAAEPFRAAADRLRWPIIYLHEPRRGISHARNRAVEWAKESVDFIAFVDDDEIPDPDWLDQLLTVQRQHNADVVTGPVLSVFEVPVPSWLAREPAFERPRFPTGTRVDVARTGNVLIRVAKLGDTHRFDARFGLSGGGDTLLFLQLLQAGSSIVWADEAVVDEWVPANRATALWSLKRAFRAGNAWSLCEREVWPSRMVRVLRLAKGVVRVVQGVALLPTAIVLGQRGAVRALRFICLGAGNAAGVLALRYQPYQHTDGC